MEDIRQIFIITLLGLGLSACCGFRIFVPLLITNIAHHLQFYHFAPGFEWMGGWTAFYILFAATILEIAAYYIPLVDNVLDHVALPIAIVAGTILTTSILGDISPLIKWALGLMIGGGSAAIVHAGAGLLRIGSSATTGGFANPVLATIENISAIVFSILSIILPVFMGIFSLCLIFFIVQKIVKRGRNSK